MDGDLDTEDATDGADPPQQYPNDFQISPAPQGFETLLSSTPNGLPRGFSIGSHHVQDEFGIASDQAFSSANDFDDLDFFELLPGLPPDQPPFFTSKEHGAAPNTFSPLEQSSRPSKSPKETNSRLFFYPEEALHHEISPAAPETSNGINQRLPRIIKHVSGKLPTVVLDDTKRTLLKTDLESRLSEEQRASIMLPTSTSLQKCLRTYFDSVHVHLPLFHLHTFELETTPSPLILAMCATGALFRLERQVAASLYARANQALENSQHDIHAHTSSPSSMEDWVRPRRGSSRTSSRPIWMTQCKVLLTFFAGFSGSPTFIRKAMEDMGVLANVANVSQICCDSD